jgi:hypothetical protein
MVFHALVARTGDDTFRDAWPPREYRDDILYPISFDAAGAEANMRVFLDAAELQAKVTPPRQLKEIMRRCFKTNYYKAPRRPGVSYMLAPILRTYTSPDRDESVFTLFNPHVYPLVLGEGKRLFEGEGKRIELGLLSATTTHKGVTLLTYRRE